MTCANCAATVERTLGKKVPGVSSSGVNFGTERATVEYDPEITDRPSDRAQTRHCSVGQQRTGRAAVATDKNVPFGIVQSHDVWCRE